MATVVVVPAGDELRQDDFVGLATVAHNKARKRGAKPVATATYAGYGNYLSKAAPSIPSFNGVPVVASNAPGPFPNQGVRAVNWDVSLPANGLGYPGDIIQSSQGAPQQIVWNNGGLAAMSPGM